MRPILYTRLEMCGVLEYRHWKRDAAAAAASPHHTASCHWRCRRLLSALPPCICLARACPTSVAIDVGWYRGRMVTLHAALC